MDIRNEATIGRGTRVSKYSRGKEAKRAGKETARGQTEERTKKRKQKTGGAGKYAEIRVCPNSRGVRRHAPASERSDDADA